MGLPCQCKKISKEQIEFTTKKVFLNRELGVLVEEPENSKDAPWDNNVAVHLLDALDFANNPLNIIKSNMIYIKKEGLSNAAINRLNRLAAFKNPDFYKAQALRLPIYNKPRVLCLADNHKDYIILPRGCEDNLIELLHNSNIPFTIEDKTNTGIAIDVLFNGDLRENQIPAVDTMLKYDIGVLSATTAFGKTVVAANIIATRKVNTLILVHTQTLMTQWKKSLSTFLKFNYEFTDKCNKNSKKRDKTIIGQLGGGKNTVKGIVDIALMQSLVSVDEVKSLVKDYGLIIVDECHHVSAVNFEKILKETDAKYILGLTATPIRSDGQHPIIFMQCGNIRYRVNAKKEAEKRNFEHFIVPRFTKMKPILLKDSSKISQIYTDLSENDVRNKLIIDDIIKAIKDDRNPIVLTERTKHADRLANILKKYCDNVFVLHGSLSTKEKRLVDEQLEKLPAESRFVLIATGKYVGEGFDFPRLDTLFLALPIAWKGKVSQYAGRLHRTYQGKTNVIIYDYVDIHIPVLERMYHKRVSSYRTIGYQMKLNIENNFTKNIIFDSSNYAIALNNDIENAKKQIIIFAPTMQKRKLLQIMHILSVPIINGVSVTVIRRALSNKTEQEEFLNNEISEYLKNANIKVLYQENLAIKAVVIDQEIVWFGNVNVLGYQKAEDNIMRLTSAEIVAEVLDLT